MDNGNFPRGGKIYKKPTKRTHEDALFNTVQGPEKKKSKFNHKEKGVEESRQISFKFHGNLTYDRLREEMIILACVKHISNLALQVEFPGLTFGLVTVNRISDAFTDKLTEELKEGDADESYSALKRIFQVGDIVPAKIVTIEHTDKGHEIQASINPKDVNAHKTHKMFKKGLTIWANVVSELDHGYELSVGVKHCRVFLPFKNVESDKKYAIGEPLYCTVHKAETSDSATTLTVSAKQEHIDNNQFKDDVNVDDVIPGAKVEFLVEEKLRNGIKGSFLENGLGFIDETQIFSKINLNKVVEGSTLAAYILFVEPITKVTYLTLRNFESVSLPQYEIGKIMSAEVLSNASRGLYLKLGKDGKGFVTNKRLLNTLPKDACLDIINAVQKKYPIGSRHSCRILDYSYMQQIYICTLEKNMIKEEIFSPNNLKLAQKMSVTIDKILPNGLVVKAGRIQGFVPNLHLSNVKYSDTIKKKYTVGMTVDARVLDLSDGNVIFTLKQGLVESEKCLTDIENATPKSNYVGFVVQTKSSGALVTFYGNIKGWISTQALNHDNEGHYIDPQEFFFLGQVVSVWVIKFKNGNLLLSLNCPNKKKKKVKLGKRVKAAVTRIHDDGVDIEVGQNKVEAIIPLPHLGSSPLLNPVLLKTYQIGDEIRDVMYIKNTNIPIVSRRECLAYKQNQTEIPKLGELKKDMLLRCSFEDYSKSGILVSTPIEDFNENIEILEEHLVSNNKNKQTFEKQQPILTKILKVDYVKRNLVLTNNVNTDNTYTSNLLVRVLEDLDRIIHFAQENKWKLVRYKIGERVKCKVKKVDGEGNCVVTLPNKIVGAIPAHLSYPDVKVGDVVEGVILDYNFVDNYVEICGRNDLKQRINSVQDGTFQQPLESFCAAQIILYTKLYAIGLIKGKQYNRQLVYLPLFINENGGSLKWMYEENVTKVKIYLERRVGNRVIALPKKLLASILEPSNLQTKEVKKKKKKTVRKRAVKEEVTEEDNDITETYEEIDQQNGNLNNIEQSHDMDCDESTVSVKTCENTPTDPLSIQSNSVILSGIDSFYAEENGKSSDESSEGEETEQEDHTKKKKKLTAQEKRELSKKEEEKIANIEKDLMDATTAPESAEQFDRLLLANPNSSELWLKYMAMHIATTELEKARAVAQRALDTINMTLVNEKFNVWMALLNLENMYGTKESFEKVFEDAVKYNDPLKVYLNVIKLLATSGKLNEMEEKIKKIRAKEKQNSKMWLEIARVYYSLEKYKEARNVKEAALKSILEKKRQFDLIIKFGIMEFQMGELEQAIANFETILDTYPSKINIWILYVDQLIKKKKIDDARSVLERASKQKFPIKSMKAILQKFISFEEQFGTSESVEGVKTRAKEYVKCLNFK